MQWERFYHVRLLLSLLSFVHVLLTVRQINLHLFSCIRRTLVHSDIITSFLTFFCQEQYRFCYHTLQEYTKSCKHNEKLK